MTALTRAALYYATQLQWPVFPLQVRGKFPIIPERRGGRGHLDATLDVSQIEDWWRRWPHANIGTACTEASGLLVLDVDPRNGGDAELAELEAKHGELPVTPMGLTGSGGYHHVFNRPKGVSFRGKLCTGVDIKARGYIVAPPSVHPETGRVYEWDAGRHPLDTPLADLPSWVLQRILSFDVDGEYGQPADDCARSFLARAFAYAGWLGKRIDAVRINVLCPWADEHTQHSGSGGTVLFAPKQGSAAGWFHCSHESHGRKSMRDVLSVLPIEACQAAAADIVAEAAAEIDVDAAERAAIEGES